MTAPGDPGSDSGASSMKRKAANDSAVPCKHRCKNKIKCGHACCKRAADCLARGDTESTHEEHSSSPTAHQRVFATTELLEMIFTFLPEPKILDVQRVCHAWKSLTDDSSTLKKKLFLQPDEKGREIVWVYDHEAKSLRKTSASDVEPEDDVRRPYIFNNMLFHEDEKTGPYTGKDIVAKARRDMGFLRFLKWSKVSNDISLAEKYHSCRQMLITQPPAAEVKLKLISKEARDDNRFIIDSRSVVIKNEQGVRYGQVLDVLAEGVRTWANLQANDEIWSCSLDINKAIFPSPEEREAVESVKVYAQPQKSKEVE